jgi:hypothetical protein
VKDINFLYHYAVLHIRLSFTAAKIQIFSKSRCSETQCVTKFHTLSIEKSIYVFMRFSLRGSILQSGRQLAMYRAVGTFRQCNLSMSVLVM